MKLLHIIALLTLLLNSSMMHSDTGLCLISWGLGPLLIKGGVRSLQKANNAAIAHEKCETVASSAEEVETTGQERLHHAISDKTYVPLKIIKGCVGIVVGTGMCMFALYTATQE
jgi:hypothetical protein